jgi:hypothetical protein
MRATRRFVDAEVATRSDRRSAMIKYALSGDRRRMNA